MTDVYIEETGAGDGDIKITVAGEAYTAEANYDIDGDGVDDAVSVMTDDGYFTYVDENADGSAELMQTRTHEGAVVEQARFAEETGRWVPENPESAPHPERPEDQADGRPMVVDTPDGGREVGPATEDTNNDGRPDTAIVPTEDGTMLVTDMDGDGAADQLVRIDDNGSVTVSHHTGHGEWTVVSQGRVDQQGQFTASGTGTDDATWNLDEPRATSDATPSERHWMADHALWD